MSKYVALERYLKSLGNGRSHTLGFAEIERAIGFELPRSASIHQAWWANQRNGRHVQANAWLDAGFVTADLDLLGKFVTFVPSNTPRAGKRANIVTPLSLDQAKHAVAAYYNLASSQVEITLRA